MPSPTRLLIPLAAVLALALPQAAPAAPPRAFDYINNFGLSSPQYETVRDTIKLPASDGKLLHIEVVRPDKKGGFPVILESSPYHGTIADRSGTRILPDPRDNDGKSIGLTGYFAPRGYAVVMMDLRGTGKSQGCLNQLGAKDAQDIKQVVEWAATRKWSNGRVGMTGDSYVGSTPSVAAAMKPKGLATIVPSAGLASMYHHQFQAGVPYYLQWTGVQWSYNWLGTVRKLPPVGKEPVQNAETGDDFGNDMQDTGCGAPDSALTAGEAQLSGQYVDWHRARDYGKGATEADIPVFAVHGVNDNAARVGALDWFLERRNSQDKLWLGQWDHGSGCCPNRRGMQWTRALHAWFDKHLMRRKGVTTGPRMELFMSDNQSFGAVRGGARTEVLTSDEWPLPKTQQLSFHPAADGTMSQSEPAAGTRTFTGTKQGFSEFVFVDPSWNTGTSFETAPVEQDMVLAGLPKLRLAASVTVPRVHLIANVLDEDAAGKRRRISQFAINPELRDGIETRTNVTPNQVYELNPPGFAMAHHLRKGHRLVLQVTTSDADKAPFFAEDPRVTVATGPGATQLTVPLVVDPTLRTDDVPLGTAKRPTKPAQAPAAGTVRTGPPTGPVRVANVKAGSVYFEFDVLPEHDNATMEGIVEPEADADLDIFLERQQADGTWVAAGDGRNDGSMTEELISTGALAPGHYRLEVNNFIGPPDNAVAVRLTFFDKTGRAGV